MPPRPLLAVLLLSALPLGACGGPPQLSRTQVASQADALCDQAYRDLGPAISGRRTDGSEGPPADAAELAELASGERRLAGQAEQLAQDARDLTSAGDEDEALEAVADLLLAVTSDLRTAATDAQDGRRREHDLAQRSAYDGYVAATSAYEAHFGRSCGTVSD